MKFKSGCLDRTDIIPIILGAFLGFTISYWVMFLSGFYNLYFFFVFAFIFGVILAHKLKPAINKILSQSKDITQSLNTFIHKKV